MYEEDVMPAPSPVTTPPNATVTPKQLADAIADGGWAHEVPNTALWLNTAFAPTGHTVATLRAVLSMHGVAVE